MNAPSCPCGFNRVGDAFSAAWHEEHRAHHLATFPDVDDGTRRNLAQFVREAKAREELTCGECGRSLTTTAGGRAGLLADGVTYAYRCHVCPFQTTEIVGQLDLFDGAA